MRFNDVTIGDLIQATSGTMYSSAGAGAPVAMNLPCGPDGQTLPCVSNGIYLVRDGAERLAIMFRPSGMGIRHTEMNLQVIGTSLRRAETVLREIRTLANERSVFRGQVISFGPDMLGPGVGSTPLSFLPRTTVTREQLVLPADLLEPALAARPGRVDLAAELPLPDADARRALLRLYQGSLVLDGVDLDKIVERTDGSTVPFLRELLRKAALLAAEADLTVSAAETGEADSPDGAIRVTGAQLTATLDQLLDRRAQLTRVLLSGRPSSVRCPPALGRRSCCPLPLWPGEKIKGFMPNEP